MKLLRLTLASLLGALIVELWILLVIWNKGLEILELPSVPPLCGRMHHLAPIPHSLYPHSLPCKFAEPSQQEWENLPPPLTLPSAIGMLANIRKEVWKSACVLGLYPSIFSISLRRTLSGKSMVLGGRWEVGGIEPLPACINVRSSWHSQNYPHVQHRSTEHQLALRLVRKNVV